MKLEIFFFFQSQGLSLVNKSKMHTSSLVLLSSVFPNLIYIYSRSGLGKFQYGTSTTFSRILMFRSYNKEMPSVSFDTVVMSSSDVSINVTVPPLFRLSRRVKVSNREKKWNDAGNLIKKGTLTQRQFTFTKTLNIKKKEILSNTS